ncbi:MAG: hypothetical protein ACK5LG_21990 [Bacteroides thetaiotaomicron]
MAKLTNTDLTNAVLSSNNQVTGSGTLDVIMNTMALHIQREYNTGRITGTEYTKAYIGMIQAAASAAVQYLLGRDTSYWQSEVQRAQVSDFLSDGSPVAGLVGKQKALYTQQIESYKRDAEVKAAKLWTDAWITMKTIDEGLLPPDQYTNAEINEVLATLKTNNVLGSA